MFPHLFSPLRLNTLTLRNRIVLSPHTTGFAAPGGYLTAREAAYQAARAQGGVALTVLGTNVVHRSSTLDYGVLANFDDTYIPGYRLVAGAVHAHGAAIFAQLNHQGSSAVRRDQPAYLSAASPFASSLHNEIPQEMDHALIQDIVVAFGAAAERCRRGGLDGVLIHAAHGYLLNQFLSPRTNWRTDEYGGSLENRMRFLLEVLAEIRRAAGSDFPLGVRLSIDEYVPGGLTLENDGLEICQRLDTSGLVDYLDISTGVAWDWFSEAKHYPAMYFPAPTWVDLAAEIKRHVKIPVACAGRIRTPQDAEQLLAENKLDLAQMARPLIADPDFPRKAQTGHADSIRTCMYISSGCLGRLHRGLAISCVQNPIVSREAEWGTLPPVETAKRIVVVGGGPAGMQAAVTAAIRGHHVTLLESHSQLGGQVLTAARAPGRTELLEGVKSLERELASSQVDVRLNTLADAQIISALAPDAIILALGSTPAFPTLDTAPGAPIYSVRDVLNETVSVGKNVLVIDGLGRIAAASTAHFLAARGHTVMLTAHNYAIGATIDSTTRPVLEQKLRECNVTCLSGTAVVSFQNGVVTLRDIFTGQTRELHAIDTIVYDMGGHTDDALYQALIAQNQNVTRIGDYLAPRGMEEAWREGFAAAVSI